MQIHFGFVLISLASLAASTAASNKIKCYSCNSLTDPTCADPLNTEAQKPKECTSDVTNSVLNGLNAGIKGLSNFLGLDKTPLEIDPVYSCMKASYTKEASDGKENRYVVRSCVLQSSKFCDTLSQSLKGQGNKDVFCEECTTDECNAASSISAAAFILIPALALLLARQ